jgi:hypothetical protein
MTKEDFNNAIVPVQNSLDSLNNTSNNLKSFLETAKGLLSSDNPISQTIDQTQIDTSVQIVQGLVAALNAQIQTLDFSMFQ